MSARGESIRLGRQENTKICLSIAWSRIAFFEYELEEMILV